MLAELMAIATLAVLIYVICLVLDKKLVGYLVILLATITAVNLIAKELSPVIQDLEQKKARVEKWIDKLP
ncbi:MAG: hypothetical protein M0021_09685 [Clostridia bacterium]|nr:hypothetical protein [Clostridia bacterium]